LRILYFSRDYSPHDRRFLTALAETRHRVGFIRLENHSKTPVTDLPQQIGILDWAGGKGRISPFDWFRLYRSLKTVLADFKPDVVMAGPVQRAALLTALTGFSPLVSVSWGYDLLLDANRNSLWRWATRFTLEHSSVFVGDCEIIRSRAVAFGMNPARTVIFPYGADIDFYTPGENPALREKTGWNKDAFVLLSSRSWEPMYGVTDLVQAFILAEKRCPALRLVMVGSGSQDAEIRGLIASAKNSDKVYFAGRVPMEDLRLFYRAADLFVSATYSDGTSISLLEAYACGLPVLVSDIPGNTEWVKPGKTGWLFPTGKIEALADAMVAAYEQRQNLPDMGRAARELAEQRGDWKNNFPRLLKAFELASKS